MKADLGIKPFADFWINCMFNGLLSVFSTKEPSFKYVACLNDYHYKINVKGVRTATNQRIDFLGLDSMKTVAEKYMAPYYSLEPFYFKDKHHYFEEIRELILQQKILAVGIDLFYWIPNSFCFEKCHWAHNSLINGFDDETRLIQVLDDDLEGFGPHEIPEERFNKAVEFLEQNPDGWLIVTQNIEPFTLTLSEVLFYAETLIKELKTIQAESLLQFNDPAIKPNDWVDAFTRYVTQVVNRQTANALLFNYLYEQQLIHQQQIIARLIQYATDIKIGWQGVRKQIMKSYLLNPSQLDQREFYDNCNGLFDKEQEMWDLLCDPRSS